MAALPVSTVHTPLPEASGGAFVRAYHHRTKHRVSGFAQGPETLDWDAQPAPFRHHSGAPWVELPLLEETSTPSAVRSAFNRRFTWPIAGEPQTPWSLATLGALLQCSLGITAHKSLGPDRWAVRANPSSGNLHPVEAYVLCSGIPFLADGVHHYTADTHGLEHLADWSPGTDGAGLFIGLTTVPWRETWKYGERAFRYCQLDVGHAMAALGVAAATLGATLREVPLDSTGLACLLGTARAARERPNENEEAEVMLRLMHPDMDSVGDIALERALREGAIRWAETKRSIIDAHPIYRWPIIERIAVETRVTSGPQGMLPECTPPGEAGSRQQATSAHTVGEVVLGRRSAQRYDVHHVLPTASFLRLLGTIRRATEGAHQVQAASMRLDVAMFLHRVDGLAPGLYFLPRAEVEMEDWRAQLHARFDVTSAEGAAGQAGLWCLQPHAARDLMRIARRLHCGQDIASSACLALAMLGPTARAFGSQPSDYRRLHREAGQLGHALYLQAEAEGLRGTGIGCFLDDEMHALLGHEGDHVQTLYHFALGSPLLDARIEDHPAYAERGRE